jgi:hypothetical protein
LRDFLKKKLSFCAIIESYKKKNGGFNMCRIRIHFAYFLYGAIAILLTSCASMGNGPNNARHHPQSSLPADYASRLPSHIKTGEKTILVDPNVHAWGAYGSNGDLVKAGIATSGAEYCPDIHRACKTKSGTFRIYSLGSPKCKSTLFPVGRGGAPMPYCMYFHGGQALHGSYEVADANISHGCVRMEVSDADWVRHDFANVGTKVIVRPY